MTTQNIVDSEGDCVVTLSNFGLCLFGLCSFCLTPPVLLFLFCGLLFHYTTLYVVLQPLSFSPHFDIQVYTYFITVAYIQTNTVKYLCWKIVRVCHFNCQQSGVTCMLTLYSSWLAWVGTHTTN